MAAAGKCSPRRAVPPLRQRLQALQGWSDYLAHSLDALLDAVAAAVDLRSRETPGHSRRVTAYALELARAAGLREPHALDALRRGALLHDVGKLGIPDAILQKTGPLDQREWRLMQRHPELGCQLLAGVPVLQGALAVVRHHHEHWDGTGYPHRLRGERIPLEARLFAVADALDAITSRRPYRPALSFEEARRRIAAEAGGQFDPEVVRIFLEIPVERWKALREEQQVNPPWTAAALGSLRPTPARAQGAPTGQSKGTPDGRHAGGG